MRMYLVSAREGAGVGVLPAGGIGFEPSAQFEMMSARETVEQLVEVRAVSFGPSGVQLPGVPCPVMFFGGSRWESVFRIG